MSPPAPRTTVTRATRPVRERTMPSQMAEPQWAPRPGDSQRRDHLDARIGSVESSQQDQCGSGGGSRRRRLVLPHDDPAYPKHPGAARLPRSALASAAHRRRLTDHDVTEPECPTDVDTSTRPASTARLLAETADGQSADRLVTTSSSLLQGRRWGNRGIGLPSSVEEPKHWLAAREAEAAIN
jgi:hypothetical protein